MYSLMLSISACVAACLVFFFGACDGNQSTSTAAIESLGSFATTRSPKPLKASPRVKRIVFVGQKEACPCTMRRIERVMPKIEGIVAEYVGVELSKVRIDVEVEEADRYDEMRSMVEIPGVYFLGGDGELVDMLQGEVTAAQIEAVLGR